jgi:hypothetical protein
MNLHELPSELLLLIAAHLTQVDLLNISLTRARLRHVAESELYREYSSTHTYGKSFKAFVIRIIDRPELRRHVHRIYLKTYEDFSSSNPGGDMISRDFKDQCTEADDMRLTQAAIDAGVIKSVLRFEHDSSLLQTPEDQQQVGNAPYDSKFCELLRTGVDEPLVILLLALLPNLRYLDLYGAPYFAHCLEWRNTHGFRSLKHLKVCASDQLGWPLGSLNHALRAGNVETLEVYRASGGWKKETGFMRGVQAPMLPAPFLLEPASTRVTRLTLQNCTLAKTHMRTLLYVYQRQTLFASTNL